jgi:hypothetical protein
LEVKLVKSKWRQILFYSHFRKNKIIKKKAAIMVPLQEGPCYGLNTKCPPQVNVLNAWSPGSSAIFGRFWWLSGESISLGDGLLGGCNLPLCHSLCFLGTMR